jgi:uncharacterized membrane protein
MEGKDYAGAKDAQIKLGEEECAKGMEQRSRYTYAVLLGVQIKLRTEVYVGGMEELAYAELRDVRIKFIREECARNMAQRRKDAVVKDVQIKFNTEEFASGMGQSTNDAVVTDVQIKLRKEECASGMAERHYVAMKDVQIMLRKVECASGTAERNYAVVKDVQIKLREEECALGMGQRYKMMQLRLISNRYASGTNCL